MYHQNINYISLTTISIDKTTALDDLIENVFFNCFKQCIDNYFSLLQHYDAENLHLMRIGLRRLKSFIWFFKKELSTNERIKINKIIKQLIKPTSKVRDYDVVYSEYILPAFHKNENLEEFKSLLEHSDEERISLHKSALNDLSSMHYQNLVQQLRNWIGNKQWKIDSYAYKNIKGKALKKIIGKKIQRRRKKIMRSKKHVSVYTQNELHKLRINIKELRYVIDILGFCVKRKKQELKLLKKLQDILGKINDTYVAERIMRDLNSSKDIGATRSYIEHQAHNSRIQYLDQLKAFS